MESIRMCSWRPPGRGRAAGKTQKCSWISPGRRGCQSPLGCRPGRKGRSPRRKTPEPGSHCRKWHRQERQIKPVTTLKFTNKRKYFYELLTKIQFVSNNRGKIYIKLASSKCCLNKNQLNIKQAIFQAWRRTLLWSSWNKMWNSKRVFVEFVK